MTSARDGPAAWRQLLDEPFGSLDAITRMQMHDLLRGLHAAHRPETLLVTHDIDEAIALADRVLVLADGVFVAEQVIDRSEPSDGGRRSDTPANGPREQVLAALGLPESTGRHHRP